MPTFRVMDPEAVRKAIEGHENVLQPEKRAMDAFYRQFVCPQCGGRVEQHFISAKHAFGSDALLPRYGLKCVLCDCVFDPHTNNLIVELGKPGKFVERVTSAGTPFVGGEDPK